MMSGGGDLILIIAVLFLLGLVGLVLSVVMYGVQLLKWLGRKLFSPPLVKQIENANSDSATETNYAVCPRPNCGHINRVQARYCAVCGAALQNLSPVNAYG